MLSKLKFPAAALALCVAFEAPSAAQQLPSRVGECAITAIARIGTRLEDATTHRPIKNSGSSVSFANGAYQVSYDTEPQIVRSKPRDRVKLCLVKIPKNCPPGDNRGRIYKTTNLRTGGSWTLPDSEHSCGGA